MQTPNLDKIPDPDDDPSVYSGQKKAKRERIQETLFTFTGDLTAPAVLCSHTYENSAFQI